MDIDWRTVQKLMLMERVEIMTGNVKAARKLRMAWMLLTGGIEINADNADNADNQEEGEE
jgi:hypothetical protein